jgi:hypothetical protein
MMIMKKKKQEVWRMRGGVEKSERRKGWCYYRRQAQRAQGEGDE